MISVTCFFCHTFIQYSHLSWETGRKSHLQGSYGSLKSMKLQDFLVVKIMYLNVLYFLETVKKSIKVHIKRVLLLIKNYVCFLLLRPSKQYFVRNIL